FAPRGPRPEGGFPPRAPREGGYQGGAPRGDRPPARAGETVRYSALTPRPAPAAPAGPEITRATRQAPRPGSLNLDRRPDFDDEADTRKGAKAATGKA